MTITPAWPRAAALALAFAAGAAAAAGPSTEFLLHGAINTPAVYDYGALAARPPVTQTVTFSAGSTPQTHTFVGASLYSMLSDAGIQTDPGVSNSHLNRIVVATGSDGYRSVYALGEINPSFGGRPVLAAYGEVIDGGFAPLGSDGFARTTAPGDLRGGRYVSNVVDIDLQRTASAVQGVGGGVSTSFAVSGDVLAPGSFDLAALQALPTTSVTVGSDTYIGVSLWSFLNATVGLDYDPNGHNEFLEMYVVATGSDGYKAAFSIGEIHPNFGNQTDIIAYELNGELLTSNGFARIVSPADNLHGRWVSNLIGLEVFHAAVPEAPTWAMLAAGGLLLALRRRVRG